MKNLQGSIERVASDIARLHGELSGYETQLGRFIWLRNALLSADGRTLEGAVKDVLEVVGYDPVPGPIGEHDLTFRHQGHQLLAEIKGSTSSASEQHIKQLHAKLTQFVEKEEIEAKPVLIINPWRQFDPGERGTGERPLFPDAIMKLVKIWKICLMTSLQVLEIYRLHLEEKLDPKRLSEEIHSTVGPLEGYQLQEGGG